MRDFSHLNNDSLNKSQVTNSLGSMKKLEFFTTPEGRVMFVAEDSPARELKPESKDFIDEFYEIISEWYAEATAALEEFYKKSSKNLPYFRYLVVHRFIRCNFGQYDNVFDIDQVGRWKLEFVPCPLRGECKLEHICCGPKVNTSLSDIQSQKTD